MPNTAEIQVNQRNDTAAAWTSADPILRLAEIGYESDTGRWKWGDGSTAWSSLAYSDTVPGLSTGWIKIDATTISGSPADHEITWDESLYSDIRIVVRGVQCASDGRTFLMILGEANGGTMHQAAGDYDGILINWATGTSYSNIPNSDELDIFNNTGSVAGEVINGTIEIKGTFGADIGGFVHSQLYAKDSSNNQRVNELKGFLDDGAAAGAIDTYRLYFAAGGLFANVGSIETYGLLI